jgi:hypothetical protein
MGSQGINPALLTLPPGQEAAPLMSPDTTPAVDTTSQMLGETTSSSVLPITGEFRFIIHLSLC